MSYKELSAWLTTNTKRFLQLNLSEPEQISQFRQKGERSIEEKKSDHTTYVCPFIGYINKNRTGCLLHPKGSPHPDIHLLKHPQNFSFYGESICQTYDCITKENKLEMSSYGYNQKNYGRVIPNHKLLRTINQYNKRGSINRQSIIRIILRLSEILNMEITSFEIAEKQTKHSFIHKLSKAFINNSKLSSKRKKGIRKILKYHAYRNQ